METGDSINIFFSRPGMMSAPDYCIVHSNRGVNIGIGKIKTNIASREVNARKRGWGQVAKQMKIEYYAQEILIRGSSTVVRRPRTRNIVNSILNDYLQL